MNKFDGTFEQNDELNINDILNEHTKNVFNNQIDANEIWSEPLEENFSTPKNPFTNKKKTPINLNLDDENEESPSDFLKNNQTLKLDGQNESSKTTIPTSYDFQKKWDHPDAVKNKIYDDIEPNVLFTAEFQLAANIIKEEKTIQLKQPNIDYEQKLIKPINVEPSLIQSKLNFDEPVAMKFNYQNVDDVDPFIISKKETTKILFDDSYVSAVKQDLTKEINDAENITLTPKIKKQISAKKIAKMKQKQIHKEQYKQVPKFFRFEYTNAKFSFGLASIFFSGILGGLGYLIFLTVTSALDYWLLLPAAIVVIFSGCIFVKSALDYSFLHKDLKNNIHHMDQSNPIASVRKLYKKLLGANISLNWISAATYMTCGLSVLLTYLVTYFINLTNLQFNDFTRLIIGVDNYLPVYFVWTFGGIASFMLVFQIIFNFINHKRRNDMELFYTTQIIDDLAATKIKKSANIKGAIIFSFSLLIIGFVTMMMYLIIRRKKVAIV